MGFRLTAPAPVKKLMEKPAERFQQGMDLTGKGFRSMLNFPGMETFFGIPARIADEAGYDPEKLGLDVPTPEKILPELPERTPARLRPFLEYVRASVDPFVGTAAAVGGPVIAVASAVSELLFDQPARAAIKKTLESFREDPDSVPTTAILPIALTALRGAGFTFEDEEIDALAESGGAMAGILFGVGVGNALLKSGNAAMRVLGRMLGGDPEPRTPAVALRKGEAPLLPQAPKTAMGRAAARVKHFFSTPRQRQDAVFEIAQSEMRGQRTLGIMESQRIFETLEEAMKAAAKETGRSLDDLRVSLGDYLKGEAVYLPETLRKPALKVRGQINRWQQEAADAGLIGQQIVDETLDTYLHRAYMAKLDPESWAMIVTKERPDVLARARQYLRENMRIPVAREAAERAPESVVIESVRKQMQSQFRRVVREGTPDVTAAQDAVRTLKKEILGNEKAGLKGVRDFLGTEKNPTPFRQMLADDLVARWNLSPQEAAGTIRAAVNALDRKTIATTWTELRVSMLKNIIKKEGVPPEIAGAVADTLSGIRRAFGEMEQTLVGMRKARLTQKEVAALERQFQERLEAATGRGPVSFRRATPDEVEGAVEEILRGDDISFHAAGGGGSARINLGPFTRRKDIPKEIRDLMGEINEGATAAALTVGNLSRAVSAKRFLDRFAAGSEVIPFGNVRQRVPWVSETRLPGYVPVQGKAWGPLDGKFILEKYADDLKGFVEAGQREAMIWQAMSGLMNFFKVSKTALNLATHMRNILGNAMFTDYAGIPYWDPGNWKYYQRAAQELMASGKGATAKQLRARGIGPAIGDEGVTQLVREAIEDGAVQTEMFGSEVFRETMEVYSKKNPVQAAKEMALRPVKAVGRVYNAEDQVNKLASYIKQREMGMVRAEAGRHVREWFPNFRDVSPAVRLARTTLGGAPFVSFFSEAVRINAKALKRHPVKAAKWIMMSTAMTEAARASLGVSRDEWEETKASLPSHQDQPMTVLWPSRDANGKLQVFDMTYTHPLGSIVAGRRQGLDVPFIGEFVLNNPILNTIVEYMTDTDPLTQGKSRKPGQSGTEWVAEMLLDNFAPSLTPGIPGTGIEGGSAFREIRSGVKRSMGGFAPGRFGQELPLHRVLLNELGPIRVTPVDEAMVRAGIQEKRGKFNELARGLRSLMRSGAIGKTKPDVVRDRAERILRQMRKIWERRNKTQGRRTEKEKTPSGLLE